jgi:2-dehydropantoate 2-reductase
MKICIFGAGAVGGHLAAKLAKAGADVSIIARGPHLAAIQANGLGFQDGQQSFTVPVRATHDPASLGPQDLVVTTLKAHTLPGVVDALQPLLGADTPIMYAVNGVPWWYFHKLPGQHAERRIERLDPAGRLWSDLGVRRALGCVVYSANEIASPGVIRNATPGANHFVLGEPDGGLSPRLQAVAQAMGQGVTEVSTSQNIRADIWKKILANMSSSTVACLGYARSCDIADDPVLSQLFATLMTEGALTARAWNVDIQPDTEVRLKRMGTMKHRPSMLQDLQAGRELEIDAQLAAVQDLARLGNVQTPMLDVMVALLVQRARADGLYATR